MSERQFGLEQYIDFTFDDEFLETIDEHSNLDDVLGEDVPGEPFIFSCFLSYKEEKYKNLDLAYNHISSAIKIIDILRANQISDQTKVDFVMDKHHVFQLAIDLSIDLEQHELTLVQIEQAKSRSLTEMLANTNLRTPNSLPQLMLTRESELLRYLKGECKQISNIKEMKTLVDRTNYFQSRTQSNSAEDAQLHMHSPAFVDVQNELGEIYHYFQQTEPEYVALRQGASLDMKGIRELLSAQTKNTAVIEFYAGNVSLGVTEQHRDRTDYRLVTGERLVMSVLGNLESEPLLFQIPLTIEHIQDLAKESFYEILQQENNLALSELASYLLKPIQDFLSNYELLIIVPYGPLHNIPFHSLPFKDRTLIDYIEVIYSPSLTVLNYCQNRVSLNSATNLVMGYDFRHEIDKDYIGEEALEIANILGTSALLEQQATKQALTNLGHGRRFIHLACHGEFSNSHPLKSYLTLAGGESLTASEIFSLDLTSNLITLSACESGLNLPNKGDEIMGLTRSLLYAGAQSVIVSLWKVDSASTKEFMLRFYQLLLIGETKSSALRKAQLELREKYQHPFYWAPFILVGNWR